MTHRNWDDCLNGPIDGIKTTFLVHPKTANLKNLPTKFVMRVVDTFHFEITNFVK